MESIKVKEYMNRHPVYFDEEMPIAEAVEKLLLSKKSGGPVINKQREVVGFLSESDCIAQMVESTYYREQVARVKDVCQRDVAYVSVDDSLLEVAQRLLKEKRKLYPVMESGKLVGTMARNDVLRGLDVVLHDEYKPG